MDSIEKAADGSVSIAGYDLQHVELKTAFRKYSLDKIDGDVSVVN